MEYHPHKWAILRIVQDNETLCKVLGSWYGGYLNGDSWKLNSGITKIEKNGNFYHFHGLSGSIYICHEEAYGMPPYTNGVFDSYRTQILDTGKVEQFDILSEENAINYIGNKLNAI